MKLRLGVIFGGESVEHEVSIISAVQAMKHLDEEKNFLTIKLQYRDINHLKKFAKFINCSEKNIKIEYHNSL